MLSLEEYISKRKREDKVNEFDIEAKIDNMRICVNYVFEYFNQYLNIEEMEQKTYLNEERLKKFRGQLELYDNDVKEWLVHIYDSYEKHIHRPIINILKTDDLFFLYHTESEFRSCSYDCYAKLVKKNPFLKDQTEMLFLFIKDYHRIESEKNMPISSTYLSSEINEWLEKTWLKYKVNIWAFVESYLNRFYGDESLWPAKHKVKSREEWQPYHYDFKQKNNLFNLNMLYTRVSKKTFMKGKKQYLEIIMMYIWLNEIWGDEENYWEEYSNKVIENPL